jgi:hypothetical protein
VELAEPVNLTPMYIPMLANNRFDFNTNLKIYLPINSAQDE